jgi:hypothetical protein
LTFRNGFAPFAQRLLDLAAVSQIRPLHKGDFYELASVTFEELIASGHRPADVWDYTPRQITAFVFLAEKRQAPANGTLGSPISSLRSTPATGAN